MQEIYGLKKEIDSWQKEAIQRKDLLEKREDLEEKKILLKEEIEKAVLHYHRNPSGEFRQKLEEMKGFLKKIDEEIVLLENLLEIYGEEKEEEIETAISRLTNAILQNFPDSQAEYFSLQKEIEAAQKREHECLLLKTQYEKFFLPLKEGASRLKAKRGALNLFFGRHPKVLLAQKLYDAEVEAKLLVERFSFYSPAAQVAAFFLKETEKKWNGKFYESAFHEFLLKAKAVSEDIQNKQKSVSNELQVLEHAKDMWLEKYAREGTIPPFRD